ncbi:lysylphosphatidylglycerol synthase domain-containing protein [Actinophytocola sp.]|uniref:lysylphosphatidylglycerol synthase domain-containing protein n=1 Tax=Actinophytocola sp. TaxID=1872138 RepID=UPI002D800FEC|nr:lysylphosphatidylglycerol synthase domain-containing protein [Actinophytocola sp.]HET9138246.1 lysylphosphatidylglycerol synthase domain-containing protein [Actinophytocola sp.]
MTAETATAEQVQLEPAPPSLRSRVVTWARRLLLLAVVAGAGYYLVTRWDEVWATLRTVPWPSAVLSLTAVIAGILFGTLSWQTIVDDLGPPIGRTRGAQIFLVSQLGKYVPGAVWAYVLQMELGKKAGVGRARMFVGSLVQLGVSIVASLALGVLALPVLLDEVQGAVWLYLVLPFGLATLHPRVMTWGVNLVLRVLRKAPLDHPLHWSTIIRTLIFSMLSYTLFGTHLWLLATADGSPQVNVLLLCVGAIAMGLTAGLFFFILPSGAGVRDLLVALALAPAVGPAAGAAFAVASRAMFTVADVTTAGAAAVVAKVHERRK